MMKAKEPAGAAAAVLAYDFGSAAANEAHYNRSTPPGYDLSNFGTKLALFTGSDDKLADPTDSAATLELLVGPNRSRLDRLAANVTVPGYGHGDFLWRTAAADEVYAHVMDLIAATHSGEGA